MSRNTDQKNSKQKIKHPCVVCKKDTDVKEGWHVSDDFNFCGKKHVYRFLETFALRQKRLEKRIEKLERMHEAKK